MKDLEFKLQRFATYLTSGNDTYTNRTNFATIDAGAGNDYLYNYADYVYMDASYGNDTIDNRRYYSTIYGGTGDDFFHNDPYHSGTVASYLNSKLYGEDGNDTLQNFANNVSMYGGTGNDSIANYRIGYVNDLTVYGGENALLDGGSGNDYLYSGGRPSGGGNVTIIGGTGYDTIQLADNSRNNLIIYNSGDGYDLIKGYDSDDTISIGGSASYQTLTSNSNVIVSLASGAITLDSAKGKTLNIKGGTYQSNISGNYISNSTAYKIYNGTAYADTVYNYADGFQAYANAGNDYLVSFEEATGVTLKGENGNDTIKSWGGKSYIDGGAGNDYLYSGSLNDYHHNTIIGGDGNDTILNYDTYAWIYGGTGNDSVSLASGSYRTLIYNSGDGYDIVYGYNSYDTISIGGSANYQTLTSGSNVIVSLESGAMTLEGAKGKTLNIVGGSNGGGNSSINNYTKNTYVYGTTNADSIYNYAGGVKIYASDGNDYIYSATASNYTINNSYGYVTIDAGAGNDSVYVYDPNISISGGTGNNSISLSSSYTNNTIKAGAGYDTIYNFISSSGYNVINAENAALTSISIVDNDAIFYFNGGSTRIKNAANQNIKFANAYTDGIINFQAGANQLNINSISKYYWAAGANATVSLGSSAPTSSKINLNNGDFNDKDNFGFYGDIKAIDAGNFSGNATLIGNAKDNVIKGGYGHNVISGDKGNDTISLGGGSNSIYYNSGDGYDIIYGYKSTDTISIGGSAIYQTLTSGSNVIVSLASGAMTLSGAQGKTLNIKGGTYYNGANSGVLVSNSTSYKTLTGTAYNDTIKNIYNYGGDYVSIDAGAGNDSIYNDWGYNITMSGGAGNDTITSYRGSRNSINGGAGADVISLSSSNGLTVIKGGAGNDTIYGDTVAHLYQYDEGDGNDIIYGYNSSDSITISGGTWSKSTIGNDVIISIANSGNITLSGAKGKTLNIYPEIATPAPTVSSSGMTQQEVIQTFMGVLDTVNSDGLSKLNQAVSVASGGYFTNAQAAINQMIIDCQNAGSASNFLTNYCGINLNNSDTGAISGADAGGSTTKNKYDIVPENGSLINFTGNNFNVNGLNVQLTSNNYNISFSSLTSKQQYMWQGLYTWWLGNSLDLIAESYGNNYGFSSASSASVKTMSVNFYRNNDNTLAYVTTWYSPITGVASALDLNINMNYYDGVNTSDPNGSSSGTSFYLDRTLAHELTHAVMGANINYFANLPMFIKEGMAELTHGIDDERSYDIKYLAGSPTALRNALSLTGQSYDAYAGGYMFLRYLAKQASENASAANSNNMEGIISNSNKASSKNVTTQRSVTISGALLTADSNFEDDMIDLTTYTSTVTKVNATAVTNDVMIIGNTAANSISAGKGADTVSGNMGNDTISGGAGDDVLFGDAGNDIIKGDAGDDTISGGYGNDTLTGGAGNNIFVHVANGDYITDYTPGADKIQISEGEIIGSSISGSDIVLATTNGYITVKGGKGKNITVIDSEGEETTKIYQNEGNVEIETVPSANDDGISVKGAVLTAKKTFTGNKIDIADYDGVKTVNASALTSGVSIVGDSSANSIKGGKGADTIFGGAGADTVSLGGGKDIYIYSGGNDFIQDYKTGEDKIKLASGSITSASLSSSNVILKTSNGNITVKGAKDKAITIIDSSGNETSQIYPVSNYPAGISVKGATLTASSSFKGNEIDIADYDGVTKVNASALSSGVSIIGDSSANSIKGGKGADTIFGGAGNDTVSLGGGKDIYIYSGGNDFIQDYKAGEDKISLESGSITSASLSSSNVILKTSNGNITVKGAKDKAITIIDGSGNETSQIYPVSNYPAGLSVKGATLTASSSFKGNEIDIADYDGVTKVNASALSSGVSIIGDSSANSIKGGKGADTIFGGAGNDTVSLGGGKDVYIYSKGNDLIQDYKAGEDKIKISSGYVKNSSTSGSNVILNISNGGKITVKGGKGKDITVTDSKGTQTYSRTLDLLYDNNFMTDDTSLDSITEQKYSVTEIQNYNNEDLAQDSTFLTYGEDKK